MRIKMTGSNWHQICYLIGAEIFNCAFAWISAERRNSILIKIQYFVVWVIRTRTEPFYRSDCMRTREVASHCRVGKFMKMIKRSSARFFIYIHSIFTQTSSDEMCWLMKHQTQKKHKQDAERDNPLILIWFDLIWLKRIMELSNHERMAQIPNARTAK